MSFLFPHQARGGDDYFSSWDDMDTIVSNKVAGSSGCIGLCFFASHRARKMLFARIFQSKGSEELGDVLPAPNTPATAIVDLPVRSAMVHPNASERTCPFCPGCCAAAWGQYLRLSPVAKSPNIEWSTNNSSQTGAEWGHVTGSQEPLFCSLAASLPSVITADLVGTRGTVEEPSSK